MYDTHSTSDWMIIYICKLDLCLHGHSSVKINTVEERNRRENEENIIYTNVKKENTQVTCNNLGICIKDNHEK